MSDNQRSWPIYAVSSVLLILLLLFGSFFLVWCGTLFFLFQIDSVVGLAALIFPGLIAWQAATALPQSWRGLPEAPRAAVGTLLTTLIFLLVVYTYSWRAGELRSWVDQLGTGAWLLLLPIGLVLAALGLIWRTRDAFQGHWIEASQVVVEDPYAADAAADDEWMHLGGA